MSRTSIQEINRMGKRLAKKCINESRRRVLAESDNWRDNHMGGTPDNIKAFEEWARKAYMMGYSPEYIQAVSELNSWVGGGAEKNGLIDWSNGWPTLKQDAYAEFANGDNNIFKRNNAAERNAWADERLSIIDQEDQMKAMTGGMPSYGGGMPGMPPMMPGMPPYGMPPYGMPPYGVPAYPPMVPPPPPSAPPQGGGSDNLWKIAALGEIMKAQEITNNEANAHPNCAVGNCRHSHQGQHAPTLSPYLPLVLMGRRSNQPSTGGYPGYAPRPLYGANPVPYGNRQNPLYGRRNFA